MDRRSRDGDIEQKIRDAFSGLPVDDVKLLAGKSDCDQQQEDQNLIQDVSNIHRML